jgi:hypothetical protein
MICKTSLLQVDVQSSAQLVEDERGGYFTFDVSSNDD